MVIHGITITKIMDKYINTYFYQLKPHRSNPICEPHIYARKKYVPLLKQNNLKYM